MEAKKTFSTDLERFRPLFLETGLIVSLLTIFWFFNLKTYEHPVSRILTLAPVLSEEEYIPITRQEPPAPPSVKTSSTQLIIVSDEVELKEEYSIDAEATQETEVKPMEIHLVETIPKEETEMEEEEIFIIVEEMPRFPGGEEARIKYLNENLHYPVLAREAGIQGSVFVSFVVEKSGAVSDVKIIRGIGGGCDEEALKVVRGMPNWIPGKQRGIPVRVAFNMPIRFVLN